MVALDWLFPFLSQGPVPLRGGSCRKNFSNGDPNEVRLLVTNQYPSGYS